MLTSPKRILKAVNRVSSTNYKKKAKLMQEKIRATDGVKKSVEVMNNFVLGEL